jgi:hypothetical protein
MVLLNFLSRTKSLNKTNGAQPYTALIYLEFHFGSVYQLEFHFTRAHARVPTPSFCPLSCPQNVVYRPVITMKPHALHHGITGN